jgi:phosphatidate cytidylyltransferase
MLGGLTNQELEYIYIQTTRLTSHTRRPSPFFRPSSACAFLRPSFIFQPSKGFFASAVKRAYKIKDFDSLIPGHGGFTDRLDCQFIMALCTYVHLTTFIRDPPLPFGVLMDSVKQLDEGQQRRMLEYLQGALAGP